MILWAWYRGRFRGGDFRGGSIGREAVLFVFRQIFSAACKKKNDQKKEVPMPWKIHTLLSQQSDGFALRMKSRKLSEKTLSRVLESASITLWDHLKNPNLTVFIIRIERLDCDRFVVSGLFKGASNCTLMGFRIDRETCWVWFCGEEG